MSEYSTPEERTEMPSDRRMGKLRSEGQMFFSQEVASTISLTTGFIIVTLFLPKLYRDLTHVFEACFNAIALKQQLNEQSMMEGLKGGLLLIGPTIFVISLLVAIASCLAVFLQTNWNVRDKKIKFNFPHINPLAGIKRIFSIPSYLNVLKGLGKLSIFFPIAYSTFKMFAPQMVQLMHQGIETTAHFVGHAMAVIFWKIFWVLVMIAIVDYFYGKWRWLRNNKMTKWEVKDERKATEGDETTKRQIMSRARERVWQRILETVPQADVVITNPTHFAVALKYDRATMAAPTVLAKGQDYLALRIREIARQNNVPVLERKALARALYSSTEVGSTIPRELFKAVAEVLAYLFRLRNPQRARPQPKTEPQKGA